MLFSGQTCAFLDKLSDKQRCHLRDRWRSIKEKPRSGGATSHCRWLEGRSLLRYRHLKYHVESDACLPDPRLIDRSFSAKARRAFDAATRVDDVGRCPKKRSMCVSVFVEPCLPSPVDRPPSGSDWIHEIKHDGFRILARKKGAQVRLYSRPSNDLNHRLPLLVAD